MSFDGESFMDRLIGSIKLGRSLSEIQSDLSKELLNRLRIEIAQGYLNEPHHNCCQLFMKELERTMEAPTLPRGGIQIGSIFGNNNTINYGSAQTSEPRASAGTTLDEGEKAYGDMQGEDPGRLTRYVLQYLGTHGKWEEESTQPLQDGNLKDTVKNIMRPQQRREESNKYCQLHGLDGRQQAVAAKIDRILDQLRSQIENSSRTRKSFLQVYTCYFPFESWDPCGIKPCNPMADDQDVHQRHPLPVMDEDGLQVRYYMLNRRADGNFFKMAQCAYACYSREECGCPDGCVFVTVTKVLSQIDDDPIEGISFQPTDHHINIMRSEISSQLNLHWPHSLVIPIPETVRETRERMSLEKEFQAKLQDVEKRVRKLYDSAAGDPYIAARAEKIRDASTTLMASRTALTEIQARTEDILKRTEEEGILEKLQEMGSTCPFDALVSKASEMLECLSGKRVFWDTLLKDLQNRIVEKETEVARQMVDRSRKAEEVKAIQKQVDKIKGAAYTSLGRAKSINTTHFGRNPLIVVNDRIMDIEDCENSITKELEKIGTCPDLDGLGKHVQEVKRYLKECQAIKCLLLRKRSAFERSAVSRQSASESQGMEESYGQDSTHRRQNPEARQPKRPRGKYM